MKILVQHLDEARDGARTQLQNLLEREKTIERLVLLDDIFGKIHVILWCEPTRVSDLRKLLHEQLGEAAGPFWSGEVWIAPGTTETDRTLFEQAWKESAEITSKLRFADRYRTKGIWLQTHFSKPPWSMNESNGAWIPPIISFYSFKGGVGRTTALAAFAIQRARLGERVVVIDLDLDAPGIGALLTPGEGLPGAAWGTLDYLLERPILEEVDLRDYYHLCAREPITGAGEIYIMPAGRLNENYLSKLARVDLEPVLPSKEHPLQQLLFQIREEIQPRWILFDSRTGLSETAGIALNGLAHLNVLFGTSSEQSWRGLSLVLEQLGAERVHQNQSQAECLLVQAMVPNNPDTAKLAEEQFENRARDEFTEHYYAEAPEDAEDENFWHLGDIDSQDAPHVPIPIHYSEALAFFSSIDMVASLMARSPDYENLGHRIISRFVEEEL